MIQMVSQTKRKIGQGLEESQAQDPMELSASPSQHVDVFTSPETL